MITAKIEKIIRVPTPKKTMVGLKLKAKHQLENTAPSSVPNPIEALKIGFKILLVFSSNIAICVNILGDWIPIAIPQNKENKKSNCKLEKKKIKKGINANIPLDNARAFVVPIFGMRNLVAIWFVKIFATPNITPVNPYWVFVIFI